MSIIWKIEYETRIASVRRKSKSKNCHSIKKKCLTLVDISNSIKDNRSKWPVSNGIKCNKYCDANDYFSLNRPDTKQHHSMVFYWRLSNGHSRSILSKTLWFQLSSPNGKHGDYNLCKLKFLFVCLRFCFLIIFIAANQLKLANIITYLLYTKFHEETSRPFTA